MAKFTTKKKLDAMGRSMRNVHILARAVKLQSIFIKENVNLIDDPEDIRAFKEMLNKVNFFVSRMDKLYMTEEKSKKFLTETNGESAIDELSLRIIDFVEATAESFSSSQTRPQ